MKCFSRYLMFFIPFLLPNLAESADQSNLWDSKLYTNASTVIRAKVIEQGGGSKYLVTKIKVLEVFKKPEGARLPPEPWVYHYSFGNGIPEGISTLYLVPYNEAEPDFAWKLLEECKHISGELQCSNGFSHKVGFVNGLPSK
jgi:hypothetical protein